MHEPVYNQGDVILTHGSQDFDKSMYSYIKNEQNVYIKENQSFNRT